jgi:hypothetical protein
MRGYTSWNRLPPSEKRAIAQMKEEEKWQEIRQYFAFVQKTWMMMACVVGYRYLGWTKEDCMLFMANFRTVYIKNSKIESQEEQQKWLKDEMDEIFGKDGFPYEYLDKLEKL